MMNSLRFLILAAAIGCGSDSSADSTATTAPGTTAGTTSSTTTTVPPTHDLDIQPIWEESCGNTCHINDDDGGLQIGLDAYDNLVGVPSDDVPSMNLIEPGSPDESYIWHKINGTHLGVGGDGVIMPRGSFELKNRKRKKIEQWILDGAPR